MKHNDKVVRLDSLRPGDKCKIKDIVEPGALEQRLLALGFIPGVEVTVVRNAPLVDPVELLLRGSYVSIRHAEAEKIEVIVWEG